MSCACHPNASVCPDTLGIIEVTSKAELAECFAIRQKVFIEEQGIPEAEEWDATDLVAQHFLAAGPDGPIGTARAYTDDDGIRIGRIAVLPEGRGTGLGRDLVIAAMEFGAKQGHSAAILDAQVYALAFYEKLGFVAEGAEFDDGSGIMHRRMTKSL